MATVRLWSTSWFDRTLVGIPPGQAHHWSIGGLDSDMRVSVSVATFWFHAGDQILALENIQMGTRTSARDSFCHVTVRNVGTVGAVGYRLHFTVVTP